MSKIKINKYIISWVLDFFINRTQYVHADKKKSKHISNTGAPQGCVASPVLFTIYTIDCQSSGNHVPIIQICGRHNSTRFDFKWQ